MVEEGTEEVTERERGSSAVAVCGGLVVVVVGALQEREVELPSMEKEEALLLVEVTERTTLRVECCATLVSVSVKLKIAGREKMFSGPKPYLASLMEK